MSSPPIPLLLELARQPGCGRNKGSVRKYLVSHDGCGYALYRSPFSWQAEALVNMLRLAEERGVAVQPVAAVCTNHLLGMHHPGSWVICRYVPGAPLLEKATEGQIRVLGAMLARLHGIEARRPRLLMSMFNPPFRYQRYLKMELRQHYSRLPEPALTDAGGLRGWIGRHIDALGNMPAYQLTHGDLYGKNIIVNGGNLALIDYESARYECCGFELATSLLRSFCIHRFDLQMALEKSYLEHASASTAGLWAEHYPFFLLWAAMRLHSGIVRRMRILAGRNQDIGEQERMAANYRSWVLNMARTIQEHRDCHPRIKDLLAVCT